MSTTSLADSAERFRSAGFLGPAPILTSAQCMLLAQRFRWGGKRKRAGGWHKSLAVIDRCIYDIATRPSILDRLELLLGPNIVLWGASYVIRQPGQIHAWHADMESARPEGGFVSVWIGLENTSRESALQVIPGSHLYDLTVQEREHRIGRRHGSLRTEEALDWARAEDPLAEVVQLEMGDGDAVFFAGRLWHGSHNQREGVTRLALLLQYAQASVPVRRPQSSDFGWPFVFAEEPPPVLAVRGVPDTEVNQIVERPAGGRQDDSKIRRRIVPITLPLEAKPDTPWTPYQLFRGSSRTHDHMNAHASVLQPGHSPHPPHAHIQEEILIVLHGKAEIMIGGPGLDDARPVEMAAGSFVYYPAWQFHTIRNVSDEPVSYLMFKWRSAPFEVREPMGVEVHHTADLLPPEKRPGNKHRTLPLMKQSTSFLGRLKAHLSEMEPGGGYDPHRDRYDVAIIVFSGKLDAGDGVIGPGHVLYYAAGVPHGLRNIGQETARYLVLEFQSPGEIAAIEERRRRRTAEPAAAV